MAASPDRILTRWRCRWRLGLSLLALAPVLAVGAALWQAVALTSLAGVATWVAAARPIAGAVRLLLIALLALTWPRLVAVAVRLRGADAHTETHWGALRWRITGWLLVIEGVLDQALLARLLTALGAPTP